MLLGMEINGIYYCIGAVWKVSSSWQNLCYTIEGVESDLEKVEKVTFGLNYKSLDSFHLSWMNFKTTLKATVASDLYPFFNSVVGNGLREVQTYRLESLNHY